MLFFQGTRWVRRCSTQSGTVAPHRVLVLKPQETPSTAQPSLACWPSSFPGLILRCQACPTRLLLPASGAQPHTYKCVCPPISGICAPSFPNILPTRCPTQSGSAGTGHPSSGLICWRVSRFAPVEGLLIRSPRLFSELISYWQISVSTLSWLAVSQRWLSAPKATCIPCHVSLSSLRLTMENVVHDRSFSCFKSLLPGKA